MTQKNILVICYYFPPSSEVGGRRWAKLTKYLYRLGYNISIIAANSFTYDGLWDEEVSKFQKNINYINPKPTPKFYVKKKIIEPLSFFNKIRFKISYYYFSIWALFKKGFFYDPSIGTHRALKNAMLKVQREKNIDAIIVSGGPFRWCYYSSKIKSKYFKDTPLVIDIRDFWANGISGQYFKSNKAKQERRFENYTLSKASLIFTVNQLISDYISYTYPKLTSKIKVLPHVYDQEDFQNLPQRTNNSTDTIILAYAGTLYPKMEATLNLLKELVFNLQNRKYKVRVYFYTSSMEYFDFFDDELQSIIIYKPLLKPKELFKTFSENVDVILQLRASEKLEENFKSSKFYEQLALRKTILYIGKRSELSEFYLNNKLGFSLTLSSEIEHIADTIINNLHSKSIPDLSFDISSFTFENQAETVSEMLQKLASE
ncbi:MAG: hypothetical protein JST67_03200 [Bacteroidetes bacterium]|nr:hypothetical protein [Bacteroidota bacterium]